uniref:WGR domain-containing protein n=1 Tax=Methylobacterium sp. B34 TaxID=95563 RepID=UPI000FE14A65
MERYELVEGSAAKFWEVGVSGPTLTVRFGRLGTQGQSKDKTCADAAAAVKEKDKLVREKTAKGYVRADGAAPAPAPAAAPTPAPTAATSKPAPAQASGPVGETVVEPAAEPAAAPPPAEAPPEHVPPPAPAAVFAAVPLPTRLCPGPRPDAAEAWRAIAAPLAAALGDAEAARLAGAPPDRDGLAAWLDAIVDAAEARRQGNPSRAATGDAVLRGALEAVLRYAVAEGGTETVARLADRRRPTPKTPRAYQRLSWAEPLHLALRAALVHAPEADYDAAVALLNARIA